MKLLHAYLRRDTGLVVLALALTTVNYAKWRQQIGERRGVELAGVRKG